MKDGKFETQKEIFEALLRGKKIICPRDNGEYVFLSNENELILSDGTRNHSLFLHPSEWSIYQEPKKKKTIEVKFYRYHYESAYSKDISITGWHIKKLDQLISGDTKFKLLKTEERIETYEVDDEM